MEHKLLLILEEPTLPEMPLDVLAAVATYRAQHIEEAEIRAMRRVERRQRFEAAQEAAQAEQQAALQALMAEFYPPAMNVDLRAVRRQPCNCATCARS